MSCDAFQKIYFLGESFLLFILVLRVTWNNIFSKHLLHLLCFKKLLDSAGVTVPVSRAVGVTYESLQVRLRMGYG